MPLLQRTHQFFEDPAPVLIILELVETGAGGSEQDNIAGRAPSEACRTADSIVPDETTFFGPRICDSIFLCCGADRVHAFDPLTEQIVQDGVIAAFIFAAENQVDVAGKGFQRLDRGINVGGFGIVVEINAIARSPRIQAMLDGLNS